MEAAAGKRCRWGNSSRGCGEQSCRRLHSPCHLGGTGDGAEGKHGRPLGWGDVTDAAARDPVPERVRGVWRGRPGR